MSNNRPQVYEEINLFSTARERQKVDNEAELFAVLATLQALEKAYLSDLAPRNEYTAACAKLIVQFTSAHKLIRQDYPDITSFIKKYKMDCSLALDRITEGRPPTLKDDKGNTSKCIAEITALFITVMDKVKLNCWSVDQLLPDFRSLLDNMNSLSTLADDHESTVMVKKWIDVLNPRKASEEISDDEARELGMDLEHSYNTFMRTLG